MSRYKKLFDYLETELNAIALESNLMEIEDIVKEMMVEDKPEPLDPHTCELCVGDVVDVYEIGEDTRPKKDVKMDNSWIPITTLPAKSMKVKWICSDGVQDIGFYYSDKEQFASWDLCTEAPITHWKPL